MSSLIGNKVKKIMALQKNENENKASVATQTRRIVKGREASVVGEIRRLDPNIQRGKGSRRVQIRPSLLRQREENDVDMGERKGLASQAERKGEKTLLRKGPGLRIRKKRMALKRTEKS